MTRRDVIIGMAASAAPLGPGTAAAQARNPAAIALPPPRSQGGKPLIEALRLRRSTRDYAARPLPPQVLSDLLWAAFGINRPESGDRTALLAPCHGDRRLCGACRRRVVL